MKNVRLCDAKMSAFPDESKTFKMHERDPIVKHTKRIDGIHCTIQ